MGEYNPISLDHPNASLTYIVAQIQKYLNEHPPDGADPDQGSGYNPVSLQYPSGSLPEIVAQIQKALSEGQFDNTEYNPISLQNPKASLPAIVAQIQKYLTDNPIPSEETVGEIVDQYLEDHPIDAPVTSVNTQTGDVVLTAADVGAVPSTRQINGHALTSNVNLTSSDVGAVPDTREINGIPLTDNIDLNSADVGAVPLTRKINNKPLSTDIILTAVDVDAVPTLRTINGENLTQNVVLDSTDIPSGIMAAGNTVAQDITALNAKIETCQAIRLNNISVASVGSTTYNVTGMTADYDLVNFGWSTGNNTNPPVNVVITTGAGTVTVNVTAVHVANATISPMFVKGITTAYS